VCRITMRRPDDPGHLSRRSWSGTSRSRTSVRGW